ncbi:hypothetical protein [Arsenicibacter rosenii]|uniref:AlgX/AlgJ SGNH hydrolase-like domain-containing protein n=1 Tax=Arsenicibacter rosenii TaxID=1750698 RepID=A0A1S2VJG0_9BACT|nr:hypothetical protein [Arsenicibacter rosenii]OIN58346.1 hypothetical protein BLX24_15245 [Arsenicibacter rosenii]
MTRLLRYSLIGIAFLLWLGGCSGSVMHWMYQTGFIADDYRFGDLYRLSSLPQFKEPQLPCDDPALVQTDSSARPVSLYIIGDSFSEPQRLSQTAFQRAGLPVTYYRRVHWEDQMQVKLDTSQYNVLMLESVERHFREHFAHPVHSLAVVQDTSHTATKAESQKTWRRQLFDQIQSKGIEERLETVLFSQDLFLWLKELKASLTLHLFDRFSPTVGLSKDRQHVFVDLDVDTTKVLNSSFAPLSNKEVKLLVDSLNNAAKRYRKAGFDAVYLSIIPNKATILDPSRGAYNHLIERIQQHPRLQIPVIDVYSTYKASHEPVYATGDSHWNCTGRRIWLNQVVKTIR